MANFQVAPKLRIVNSIEQFVVSQLSKKANGAYEAADGIDEPAKTADTDLLRVEGFIDLHRGNVTFGSKSLSVPPQKQVGTLTVTATAIDSVQDLSVEMIVKTYNLEHEFVRFDGKNQKSRFYNLVVRPGDTASTIADRISTLINLDSSNNGYVFVTTTVAADVITVNTKEPGWEVSFKVTGASVDNASVTAVFAETTPAYEGRYVYRDMNVKRLQNPNRSYAYAAGHYVAANEVPSPGNTYTLVTAKFSVERTDLSGPSMQNDGPVKGTYEVEAYFKDGDAAIATARDLFVDFLKDAASVFNDYPATTPAEVIVTEVPTVTTN